MFNFSGYVLLYRSVSHVEFCLFWVPKEERIFADYEHFSISQGDGECAHTSIMRAQTSNPSNRG